MRWSISDNCDVLNSRGTRLRDATPQESFSFFAAKPLTNAKEGGKLGELLDSMLGAANEILLLRLQS